MRVETKSLSQNESKGQKFEKAADIYDVEIAYDV